MIDRTHNLDEPWKLIPITMPTSRTGAREPLGDRHPRDPSPLQGARSGRLAPVLLRDSSDLDRTVKAMRVTDLLAGDTPATHAAREVVTQYSSPALVNHCERAYLWSAALGELTGLRYDRELLYVASMVHDLGLVRAFDNHLAPFEDAGGDVGWVFAAGAGWPLGRRIRVKEIVVRHMWDEVDPSFDAEGHLLCEGTGLDITGRNAHVWPGSFRAEVIERFPRLGLPAEFMAAFEDQARRKPGCAAAAAIAAGLADRIVANPLDDSSRPPS